MSESPTIAIGSLQFSPIYKSHCCALGNQCRKYGFETRYLFSNQYRWMLSEEEKSRTTFIGNSKDLVTTTADGINPLIWKKIRDWVSHVQPDYVYMYNFHPLLNLYLGKKLMGLDIKLIQHIHEPYVDDKSNYSLIKQIWLPIFEHLQKKVIRYSDTAVLSSDRAMELFQRAYDMYEGDILKIPLLYEDHFESIEQRDDRQYICYMGPPTPAKSPEFFLELAAYAGENDPCLQFLVISNEEINNPEFHNHSNVNIYHESKISDQKISELLSQSFVSLTPFKTATQSSTILTSYMCGTPVVSSRVGGLTEFVDHRETGCLLSLSDPIEDWVTAIRYVRENFDSLSPNCRSEFINHYSEVNWEKYFVGLFDDNI